MKIHIYLDRPSASLSTGDLSGCLEKHGLVVIDKGNLIDSLGLNEEELATLTARTSGAIIQDIEVPRDNIGFSDRAYLDLERKRLTGLADYSGVFYDGYWLQRIFFHLFRHGSGGRTRGRFIPIVFTGRLFGTFEKRRYHARVILMGVPNLISTSGLVEAPARPREYYWLKAGFVHSGRNIADLDGMYKGRFVEYDDPRITPILASYALQAVSYELSGKEFCDDKSCCLYNSHWQEEVLAAQLEGKLCQKHRQIITSAP